MANVQKIIKTAAYDSIKKMRSFRFISAVMMVVGLVLAVTSGMDQLIGDVNEKVSIWIVPHIFSNTFFAAFYGKSAKLGRGAARGRTKRAPSLNINSKLGRSLNMLFKRGFAPVSDRGRSFAVRVGY